MGAKKQSSSAAAGNEGAETAPVHADALRGVFAAGNEAFLENDLLQQQQEAAMNNKRKSLGRRVSFAATAKVRLFDNNKNALQPGKADLPNPLDPKQDAENVDANPAVPGTPSRIPVRASPARKAHPQVEAVVASSPHSVSSFEVDVKEGTDMSLLLDEDDVDEAKQAMEVDDASSLMLLSDGDEQQQQGHRQTMDFTQVVFASPKPNAASSPRRHSMDFTTVLDAVLNSPKRAASATETARPTEDPVNLFSPSPFYKPESQDAKIRPSDMSMVLDDNDTINTLPSVAPVDPAKPGKPPVNAMDDLFKQLINQDQVLSNSQSAVAPASAPSQHALLQNSLMSMEEPRRLLPTLSQTPQGVEVCDVRSFLSEHGIRFLDNLTSLQRRETNSRPRDSSIATVPGRALFVQAASVPESDIVDKGAEHLVAKIVACREHLDQLQARFNVAPPAAYSVAQSMPEEQISLRLKTLKSVARLTSKQEWYQWRRLSLEDAVNGKIDENARALAALEASLDRSGDGLSVNDGELVAWEQALDAQLAILRRRQHMQVDKGERERAGRLRSELADLQAAQAQQKSTLDLVAKEESALREHIQQMMQDKRDLSARVKDCQGFLQASTDVDSATLEEVKSQVAMLTALQGWKFVSINQPTNSSGAGGHVIVQYAGRGHAGPVHVKFDLHGAAPTVVRSVQINSAGAKSRLLRQSFRLVSVEAGHSLLKTMNHVLLKLDALSHLDRDLGLACMQCDVQLESPEEPAQGSMRIRLGFFHYEHKCKLTATVAIELDKSTADRMVRGADYALSLLAVDVEYGRAGVADAIGQLFCAPQASAPGNVLLPLVAQIKQLL